MSEHTDYVTGHVQEALAHAGETDVHVALRNGRLVMTGNVATAARRDAAVEIAAALAEDLEIDNEVAVLALSAPDERETIES